ncbi:MAG: potassium channel family protein [Ignavibacteriaceae bacterium]|nr:potassium channel family protein [Ignavibacteriaceae bacterium]
MKNLRRKIFLFLERLSFLQLLSSFFIIVILFAICYSVFSPGDNGIRTIIQERFDFGKSIYFSLVTISSLGYGDMQPMGISRWLSVCEVLLGLSIMGMLIAKLTSSRLSYHVKRLYVSDSNRQLSQYLSRLTKVTTEINNIILIYSSKFADIPNRNTKTSREKLKANLEEARQCLSMNYFEYIQSIKELKSYINIEVSSSDFLSEISHDILESISSCTSDFVKNSYQFLTSISDNKRGWLLYGEPGKRFQILLDEITEFCKIVQKSSKDNQINLYFSSIESDCIKSKNDIIIVSIAIFDINPPDQIIDVSTELQSI